MKTLIIVAGFVCILYFPISVLGQFYLPKVPAEKAKYNSECVAFAETGYTQRCDFRYKFDDDKVTTQKYNDRIVKFDSKGKIKEFVYIDKSGRNKAIVVFEYFSNGLPKSEGEFYPTGEFLKRTNYKYNFEGQLLEKSTLDQYENVIRKTLYFIDEANNTIVEKIYPFPSIVKEKNIWVYSSLSEGKIVQHERYNGETVFQYKRKLSYKNNKLISEEFYNPAGNIAFYLEYTYNTKDLLLQIEKVLLDGTRLKNASYQYDNSDLIISEINYDRYGKMQRYYKYTYK